MEARANAVPFLPIRSKGGPHDDAAYMAGYEMGAIDILLGRVYTHDAAHHAVRPERSGGGHTCLTPT